MENHSQDQKPHWTTIRTIFCICTLCLICSYPFCQVSITRGTLIIATPSKEGLVIVADKKIIYVKSGESIADTITKIIMINKFAAFTIAGETKTIYQPNPNSPPLAEFDPTEICRQFFINLNNQQMNQDIIRNLQSVLTKSYQLFLENSTGTVNNQEKLVFVFSLFRYDSQTNNFETYLISLNVKWNSDSGYSATSISKRFKFEEVSKSQLFGTVEFASKIKNGDDNILDSASRKIARQFLTTSKSLFNKKKVIEFSKWLMTETSKRYNGVGNKVDIATINTKTGFHWQK